MKKMLLTFNLFFLVTLSISQGIYSASFSIDQTIDIASGPHIAFPSVLKLPNDSLLIVYRRGSSHVEPTGRIMRQMGSPDGLVWSSPEVVINSIDIDDRDPSLTLLADGRIMMNFFTHKSALPFAVPPVPVICAMYVSFSSDLGQTFSEPVCIDENSSLTLPVGSVFTGDGYDKPDGTRFQNFVSSSAAFEIQNRIIIPAYGGDAYLPSTTYPTYLSSPSRLCFIESNDDGVTWQRNIIAETIFPNSWLSEPDLVRKNDGTFIMHYRGADDPTNPMSPAPMRQAILSSDLSSFEPDFDFSFVGHAPDLYKLSNGVLVSGFRKVNTSSSQDVCFVFSIDDGVTWSDTLKIMQGTIESGYPSFTQLAPDKLLMTYYTSGGVKIKGTILTMNCIYIDKASEYPFASIDDSESEMNVFPNPNNGSFHIQLNPSLGGEFDLRIINSLGQVLITDKINADENNHFSVNLESDELPGFYFAEISNAERVIVHKFLLVD